MEQPSVGRKAMIIFATNNFLASFRKRNETLNFYEQDSTFPHSPLRFLSLTPIFYKRICRIHLLIAKLHWQRRNWPGLKVSAAENYPPASSWRKQLKTQTFSEGKFHFVVLLWTNIQYMPSHCSLGDRIWSVKCIQILAESFLIFSTKPCGFRPKIFWQKMEFWIKLLHYLKFNAFSVPYSDVYHLNWEVD